MKKGSCTWEKSSERAEAEREREGQNSEDGFEMGGPDKAAIRKPLRERVVPHRAGLLAAWRRLPNGHSYDMSDVGQPRLFSPLWRRHTEQRDNEVQSGGGKEGQL